MRFPACWWAAAVVLPLWLENLAVASPAESKTSVSIRWTADGTDTNRVVVEVAGLESRILRRLGQSNWAAPEWQRLFSVYAEQGDVIADIGLPPMLGDYGVGAKVVSFKPRFPLEPGVSYRAIFRPMNLPFGDPTVGKLISSVFRQPSRSSVATTVVRHVYPSAAVVPENLLKFYVHFSAPMSRGHIYDHIQLLDEAGKAVELPFLEIDEELWDPAMTRLTLFIDPGRIKREVKPLEEIGPALEAGKRFTLVIASAWKDADGNRLREDFRKRFEVGPPDREPPDPARWRFDSPRPSSVEPLSVTFPEAMDHALAERMIRVTDETGRVMAGKVTLENDERQWTFHPDRPWPTGAYRLAVQTTIEDLAGNNIGKPFEVDLVEPVQRRLTNAIVTIAFEVR